MNAEYRARVEEIFESLADLPRSEQRRLLEKMCGSDSGLLNDVDSLLIADATAQPLLDESLPSLAGMLFDTPAPVPGKVGRYIIQNLLGEGGMGAVYLAEREGLGDLVAIKFLRDAWGSPIRRERFASEQRLLARLTHRSVARLYDAGVIDQTPWFAMEYVDHGVPVTQYCRDHPCPLRRRLELFVAACEAVSCAHRNLTVHLDLKPSNILVNVDGEVKLVDFGIAKSISAGGDISRTMTALQMLSLEYAAPEQIRGEGVGVETDVYSLGVVLFELLTGKRPFDSSSSSPAEILQRLDAEPEKPSMMARGRAARVETELPPVVATKSEWADLDVLCLKAMHSDRHRRYATVDALLQDVQRFLAQQPLQARPERFTYRLRKFVARNRRAVVASALVIAFITLMASFFTYRLIETRNRAIASQARTDRIQRLMLSLFEGDDDTDAGPSTSLTALALLQRGVQQADTLSAEPDVQAELRFTLGDLFRKLGRMDQALPLLRTAHAQRAVLLGPSDPLVLKTQIALSRVLAEKGELDEARKLANDALEKTKSRYPNDSAAISEPMGALGKVMLFKGDYAAAIETLEQTLRIAPSEPLTNAYAEALTDLANAQYQNGNPAAAEKLNLRGLELDRKLLGNRHPSVAVDLYNLAAIKTDRGDYRESEQLLRQSLQIMDAWYGKNHPRTSGTVLLLGRTLQYQSRWKEAGELYQRAYGIATQTFGPDHFRVAIVLNYKAMLAAERGDADEAERNFRRSAAIFAKDFGERHEFYAVQLAGTGYASVLRGDYARADKSLKPAMELLEKRLPEGHRLLALVRLWFGKSLAGQRRYREAEYQVSKAWNNLNASPTQEAKDARMTLISIYKGMGEPEKAQALQR